MGSTIINRYIVKYSIITGHIRKVEVTAFSYNDSKIECCKKTGIHKNSIINSVLCTGKIK